MKMIRLKIDNKEIAASEGMTILEAARSAGIGIPSMCHLNGHDNHPSCMVCMVKDRKTGHLIVSCALKATEGMDLLSDDPEVYEARKTALELLLSDHLGDCEAPCTLGCPAHMNIPLMNRRIAEGDFDNALTLVKEDIALPYILGYICPAPCEKACRRKQIDNPVSVCLIKRSAAQFGSDSSHELKKIKAVRSEKIAIIGTGPAGLSAAYYLLTMGYNCTLYDRHPEVGGTLRYAITHDRLPREVINYETQIIKTLGARFIQNFNVTLTALKDEIIPQYNAVIVATGDEGTPSELRRFLLPDELKNNVGEGQYATTLKGVFVCGSIIRPHKMAVRSVAQAKECAYTVNAFLEHRQYSKPEKLFNSRFEKLRPGEYTEYLKETLSIESKSAVNDLYGGLTAEEAIHQAQFCLHCDCRKPNTCRLRKYASEYNADRKRYLINNRKSIVKVMQHAEVIYEPGKCIKCGLCIEIAEKNNELSGLSFSGRGFDVRVEGSLGVSMADALTHTAEMCVNSCPTGALSFKQSDL